MHDHRFGVLPHRLGRLLPRLAVLVVISILLASGSGAPEPALTSFRTIDGTDNNLTNTTWGATNTELLRLAAQAYGDGISTPAGATRLSAREISNIVMTHPGGSVQNPVRASDWVWQWGQFVDHDIDLTPGASPAEPFDIPVPLGDPFFDPFSTGTEVIGFSRSTFDPLSSSPFRQQLNLITSYIDASNVYGSDLTRANELRTLDGTGMLKLSTGNLLIFNTAGLPNAPDNSATYFLSGDVRANEQLGLTATHTLFTREHNAWAARLHTLFPALNGDQIYENARAFVGAEIQVITYNEFIPALMGNGALPAYTGYNSSTDPSIANEFSTSLYRVGHTMLSPTLLRLDANLNPISAGNIPLQNAFFNPSEIVNNGGIEPLLRGLARQIHERIDGKLVDDVRNFLFGPPGAGGFDLASLNIQRGRDHGLPDYNTVRAAYGLAPKASFADISSDPNVQAALAAAYASVDDIDSWVGGLSEDRVPGSQCGELVQKVLVDQFTRLRDGDRFFYKNYFPTNLQLTVETQNLSKVIKRNTPIGSELQNNVFKVP